MTGGGHASSFPNEKAPIIRRFFMCVDSRYLLLGTLPTTNLKVS
jgi:hypothetical protein